MLRVLVWIVLLVLPSALAFQGPAVASQDLTVPEGETRVVDGPLDLRGLDVRGTLVVRLPADAAIRAERVHVGPTGVLRAPAGEDGVDGAGLDATGTAGRDGGSVLLRARSLVVEEGGAILGGAGGRGGSADGFGVVVAGAGGDGGAVVVEAAMARVKGAIAPGAGGDGGHARQVVDGSVDVGDDAKAVGGDGGDAGVALLNGAPVRPDPRASVAWPTAAFPGYLPPCSPAIPVGAPGLPGAALLAAGHGGNACMIMVGDPGASGNSCGAQGTGGLPAKAVAIAGNGGDAYVLAGNGGIGGAAWAAAKGGDGGAGGDCTADFSAAGSGGGGGGATAEARGGNGGAGGLNGGQGGHGGCGRSEAKGGHGGRGGFATSGAGGGGAGGGGASALAEGGAGGSGALGRATGGLGGCAHTWGAGGRGGAGGNGNPVGGRGGDAAPITKNKAAPGGGGDGAPPGPGGGWSTLVDPEGGKGGYPNGGGGNGGNWISVGVDSPGGAGCDGHPPGAPGTGQHDVPPGTGRGGDGGNPNDPDENRGRDGIGVERVVPARPVPPCPEGEVPPLPEDPPVGGGDDGLAPNLACEPEQAYHVYYGSGSIRVGVWHVLRPTTGFTQFNDGNTLDDCGNSGSSSGYAGFCGQYPWSDPLTYPLPGSGWCDGVPGDFDHDLDGSIGGGFFPGGPWATDPICDYGYFPHHGAVPEIDDVAYPALGVVASPAFSWGADDTGLGQTGDPLADAGSGYFPTTDPWDATFGDGQACLTSGSITPNTDPDDWLQLCFGDASIGTTCVVPNTLNTYPAAGGDGGFVAFTLTAVTADTGHFDWVPDPVNGGFLHDHGGYQTTCDPTHPDYVLGTACHAPEVPKEVFVTVAGVITS